MSKERYASYAASGVHRGRDRVGPLSTAEFVANVRHVSLLGLIVLTRIGDPSHLRKVRVDVCVGVLAKFLMQSSQTQKAAGLGCNSRAGNDHVCRSSHGSRGAGSFS